MNRRGWIGISIIVLLGIIAFATIKIWLIEARGFSARAQPTMMETMMARMMRSMAMPSGVKQLKNPYPSTPMRIAMASQHFAAHCALCHNNNGDGNTDLGKDLYPHPPSLTSRDTEKKSDGELFYVIRNGIRLSGMPAWPEDSKSEIWELVNFIRQLPRQTKTQQKEMKKYDPKSIFPEPIM